MILHQSPAGTLQQIDWKQYKGSRAINPSSLAAGLRDYLQVDVRAIHNALHGTYTEPSAQAQDRMDRGSVVHMALLQPERLGTDIAVWRGWQIDPETCQIIKSMYVPRKVGSKTIAKQLDIDESIVSAVLSGATSSEIRSGKAWDAFEAENSKKLIMRAVDYDQAMAVANEVRYHEIPVMCLRDSKPEVAMFTTEDGVDVRGQVDAVSIKRRVIVDIKTTDSGVSDRECESTIRRFHYREKMALYRRWIARITESDPYSWKCYDLFISMDAASPSINLVRISEDALQWGEARMINALQCYQAAVAANDFPIMATESCVSVASWEMSEESEVEIEY